MTTGERIRAARKKAKLTQDQLSMRSGIAAPTIRSYESGRLNPKIETLSKLAKALEVDTNTLLGDTELLILTGLDTIKQGQKNGWEPIDIFKNLEPEQLEKRMEEAYYSLSDEGKRVAVERVEELAQLPQYQKKHPAGDSPQSAGAGDENDPE